MKKLIIALAVILSGCSQLQMEESDIAQATTSVDAVEGSTEQGGGLIDMLRRREDPQAGDPAWASIRPQEKPEHYATATGSLFNVTGAQDLYDDTKPRGIGDIVTVLLEEKTQAKKSASSDLDKSTDLSMDPLALGGQEIKLGERNLSYEVSNANKFAGSTSADQSNSIKGSISVEVIDVLANGNLLVRGEKWLTLNTGDEYIRVSGTVRPDDISQENTIASTRIANARIQYSGTGERQDVQEQGWLARFFNVSI
ncbi:flagellar basal body L-ring protein FlgH [Photobacterium alginatilyticum]|uniref:Flagellar L-ring protein n=1 Tax=Photobacterium alginatilyticum TaxID=1775171 RepID=A0ABW9YE22_9GAMM|nr:flagellar basal body L-ring protein FlgH [Photobacterium alginatilyticum]NBI51685.1 flagellar basal body L-ring protein FlgH [Photobacterium alginatilyticum]